MTREKYHHQQYARRRLPKRYSDIVGPSSVKVYLSRKDSIYREKKTNFLPLSQYSHCRTSLKSRSNEGIYIINSHNKKSIEILSSIPKTEKNEHSIGARRYSSKNKGLSNKNAVDLLAHRMQVAMSTELMHSLDRNFVFGDRHPSSNSSHMTRSHSFNISTLSSSDWRDKSLKMEHYYHVIPRVKRCLDDERKSIETIPSLSELTPDYDEEIIIRRIHNDNDDEIGEEPTADYDDSKSMVTPEIEKSLTSSTLYDLKDSSSFAMPQTSIIPSSEACTQYQSSIPPTPPPLPNTIVESKKTTFRCRTIADKITADHKLILKDEAETKNEVVEEKQLGNIND